MKKIGLIGGMSWESSALYYQYLNQKIQQRMGHLHSAKVILNSVDFHEIEYFQRENLWNEAGAYLAQSARELEHAGVDVIALCTNTMHKVVDQMTAKISIPFLHIADATVQAIQKQNIKKVGLLGTAFTMEQDFYKDRIIQSGIEVVIPNQEDRMIIHDIIYQELCQGKIEDQSKQKYQSIIRKMQDQGIHGVILGCTEIGLLIQQEDLEIHVFDTTMIHVNALVEFALS